MYICITSHVHLHNITVPLPLPLPLVLPYHTIPSIHPHIHPYKHAYIHKCLRAYTIIHTCTRKHVNTGTCARAQNDTNKTTHACRAPQLPAPPFPRSPQALGDRYHPQNSESREGRLSGGRTITRPSTSDSCSLSWERRRDASGVRRVEEGYGRVM